MPDLFVVQTYKGATKPRHFSPRYPVGRRRKWRGAVWPTRGQPAETTAYGGGALGTAVCRQMSVMAHKFTGAKVRPNFKNRALPSTKM